MKYCKLIGDLFFVWLAAIAVEVIPAAFNFSLAAGEPLVISNEHPLAQIHLSPTPVDALSHSAGALDCALSSAWSNTINRQRGDYLIDAEGREASLSMRYFMYNGLAVGLRQGVLYRGGGVSDSWIDEWHKLFNLPRGARAKVDKDEYHIEGQTRNGEDFQLTESGAHFSDLDLFLIANVFKNTEENFFASLRPMLRLPTGSKEFGQNSLDYGLTFAFTNRLPQWDFDYGVSFAHYNDVQLDELQYHPDHWSAFLSVEYKLVSGLSLLSGLVIESALISNIPRFPDYQAYVDLGLRLPLSEAFLLDLSFRENPLTQDSTTDFTLYAAIRWRGSLGS